MEMKAAFETNNQRRVFLKSGIRMLMVGGLAVAGLLGIRGSNRL